MKRCGQERGMGGTMGGTRGGTRDGEGWIPGTGKR